MRNKFRIWTGEKMLTPENIRDSTYRYLLNRDGIIFGIDLRDMKWDGMVRYGTRIMFQIGRRDMDGRETYEGDVVKVQDWADRRRWLVGLVEYDEPSCSFVINFDAGPEIGGIQTTMTASPVYKIIGHRYQEAMQRLLEEQKRRFMDPEKEVAVYEPETEEKAGGKADQAGDV